MRHAWNKDRSIEDTINRFMEKVNKVENGCWLWQANHDKEGYGHFTFENKERLAHRVAYQLFCEPIPEGLDILHSCDTPACVNPNHLRAGTHRENMLEMFSKGRRKVAKGEENSSSKLTWGVVKEIRALYTTGNYNQVQLGKMFNVDNTTIHLVVKNKMWVDMGYSPPNVNHQSQPRPSDRNSNIKFTWEDIREIRRLHSEGIYRPVELARIYKTDPSTIGKIIHHKTWKEVA